LGISTVRDRVCMTGVLSGISGSFDRPGAYKTGGKLNRTG
jgi:hypothetical protein